MARKPMSAETKRKISEALKRHYASKKKGEGSPDKEGSRSTSKKRKNVKRKVAKKKRPIKARKPVRVIKRHTMEQIVNNRNKIVRAKRLGVYRPRARKR